MSITRQQVEEFLYEEAALLDAWRLDEWLGLLTEDAVYNVPSNDRPDADPKDTLFIIADDIRRIRARVARLKKPDAHAEYPPSRTRRMITNVRIVAREADKLRVEANFSVHRFRRNEGIRDFVGHYRYELHAAGGRLRIARREAIIDSMELGSLASVSFIL
jgi:p-cumate 2,3-dioxygenase beta subunit